ncbi:MAG: phosphotransferase [Clostridiaceae bacterium]|nr:phosphotransferase [Clostridiaceae bacterium]
MISENKVSILLNNYEIEDYGQLLPITSGTANKSYLLKDCKGLYTGNLVIRIRSLKYSSELQMLFEEEYLRHVYSKGIPVPVPLKVKNGQCWYNVDGNTYQIYPFIDGGDFDCNSDSNVTEGGTFLGKLHTAVSDFMPVNERYLPRYDSPDLIMDALNKTMKKNWSKITGEEKRVLEFIIEQTMLIKENVPDRVYDSLPKLIIHGDYHPANVKYKNGKICGLFDFDWVSRQPRIRDIVDGIIYFSSKRDENIKGDNIFSLTSGYIMDLRRIKIFFDAYNKSVNLTLSPQEINCIPYLICARLIHSRVQALPKIPEKKAVKMLTYGMEEILNWVNNNKDEIIRIGELAE